MRIPLLRKVYVAAIGALLLTVSVLGCVGNTGDDGADSGVIIQSGSYEGIPSADPNDGKFVLIASAQHQTIESKVVAYIGIPANESTFEVGIFDGDVGQHWDYAGNLPTNFTLYMDPLKNGTTAHFVESWSSDSGILPDDDWYSESFSVSTDAQAPSGNYFYRLVAEWEGGTPSSGLNDFKVRTTGQISLASGHEFGFSGGPQALIDPDFGTSDNTYDGEWCYNFYVPIAKSRVAFLDGDADIKYDTDDPNTPPPEGRKDGQPPDDTTDSKYRISPNIHVLVTDPDGNEYLNSNPSGNQEWEIFSIGDLADDDHTVNYSLSPGLWQYEVKGMDAHNANFLETTYEVFVCGSTPPLPVNPPPEVGPDYDEDVVGGATYYYPHTVTNKGVTQAYDLTGESTLGWFAGIFEDSDGNGVYDVGEPEVDITPDLGTNETYYVLVAVDVPVGPPGAVDTVSLTASSRIEWAVQDSAIDEIGILVNQPPVPDAGGYYLAIEGDTVTFDASGSSDPDGDTLQYMWDVDDDGVFETSYSSSPSFDFTFGDDFTGTARVRVTDGEFEEEATADIVVSNYDPVITDFVLEYTEIVPRTQGYWNHQCGVIEPYGDHTGILQEWVDEIAAQSQVFDWIVTEEDVCTALAWASGKDMLHRATGQLMALWLNAVSGKAPLPTPVDLPDLTNATTVQEAIGEIEYIILNVDDKDELERAKDIADKLNNNQGLPGTIVIASATATDPGSDDLTFTWDWGDNTTESRTYYNDGVGPDPYPSYNVNPMTVTDETTHFYAYAGSYILMLTVTDDDGGTVEHTLTIDF